MTSTTLFLDLGSPYAYLAAERVHAVIPGPVDFQPVLLGAIFQRRGWGSWAQTEHRAAGMAEVEARAERYGLAPMVWPEPWPANALAADRAAAWAKQRGSSESFILALYRREFRQGADISSRQVLAAAATDAGLDPDELIEAIQQPEIKDALRQATDAAWEVGVRGVPSLWTGGEIYYGDDQLEAAGAQSAV
jgi:2-hydroxychromene-2-carboxylate isomerase